MKVFSLLCFSLTLFVCLSQHMHADVPSPFVSEQIATEVKDREGTLYSVYTVSSQNEFSQLAQKLIIDYRVRTNDTEESLSCFKGIALDPNYSRAQLYCIKQGASIIGVATLLAIPYKHLSKRLYLKKEKNRLSFQSLLDLYHIKKQETFLIEVGWLQLLPEYRAKQLGLAIVTHVLIPTIHELLHQTFGDVFVSCYAEGAPNMRVRFIIAQAAARYQSGKNEAILITKEIKSSIGKVEEGALFTPNTAERMGLRQVENLFDLSLGPVFIHRYFGQKKSHLPVFTHKKRSLKNG